MFWRLVFTFSVLVLSAVGLLGTIIVQRVERYELRQIEDGLRARAVLVREAVRADAADEIALQKRVEALGRETGARITLVEADGRVRADSEPEYDHERMENHAGRPEILRAQEEGVGTDSRLSQTVGRPFMYLALRTSGGPGPVAFVRVALPLDAVGERLAGLRRLVWTTAALTALVALALSFALARRIAGPLQEITRAAERVGGGGRSRKVYAAGRDEVGKLARAFNRMSERLEAQIGQLEEDRQQLRTILSGMVEGVVALDAEQRVLFANDRAAELMGLPVRGSVGRPVWEVVRHRALLDVVQRALAHAEPQREELNWDGGAAKRLTVHAARLPGAPPRGLVLVLHDTTELRRLERLRQDFVANVSHELKTPLSVIKACAETLLDGAADDPQHRGPFLEQIAGQAERLHALILDLLSLARIESGEELFVFEAVPLDDAVADCLDRHRARAEAKGQTLEVVPLVEDRETRRQGDQSGPLSLSSDPGLGRRGGGRPDPRQPRGQRHQVHPAGRTHPRPLVRRRGPRLPGGRGRRHRHPRAGPAAHLRALLPRGQGAVAPGRRHRARPVHRQAPGAGHARQHPGHEPRRPGDRVHRAAPR